MACSWVRMVSATLRETSRRRRVRFISEPLSEQSLTLQFFSDSRLVSRNSSTVLSATKAAVSGVGAASPGAGWKSVGSSSKAWRWVLPSNRKG
ncbi:hypothetical protein D3C80_1630660 [compost metagenome]